MTFNVDNADANTADGAASAIHAAASTVGTCPSFIAVGATLAAFMSSKPAAPRPPKVPSARKATDAATVDAIVATCYRPAAFDEDAFAHDARQLGKLLGNPANWNESKRDELVDAAGAFYTKWASPKASTTPATSTAALLQPASIAPTTTLKKMGRPTKPENSLEYVVQCARMLKPPPTTDESPSSVARRVAAMGFPINTNTFRNKWPQAWALWLELLEHDGESLNGVTAELYRYLAKYLLKFPLSSTIKFDY